MSMRKAINSLLRIIVIMISIISLGSCKKKSFAELNAEHIAKRNAIEKKLTKRYCYDITKMALGQKFSRIDTIIITKYSTHANNDGEWKDVSYPSAYVRTDGKVKGKIYEQEGTFTYWFETNIKTENIDSKLFEVMSMFAKDQDGYHVIYNDGINDYTVEELKKENENVQAGREYAKKMEIIIDGIKVYFCKKSDLGRVTGLYYDSDKKLSSNQMKRAVKKIQIDFDFVEFSLKGKSYAYYDRGGDYVSYDLR